MNRSQCEVCKEPLAKYRLDRFTDSLCSASCAKILTERARIKEIWDRFENWEATFLYEALKLGHPHKNPHRGMDDDCMPTAQWFGNGPQGSEPARMCTGVNEDLSFFCFVSARVELPEYSESTVLDCYLKYLELNGWLHDH